MARAYSDDLRKKLIESYLAGKGTVEELADSFGVSGRWAWKVMSAYKRNGTADRPPQSRHGKRPMAVDGAVLAMVRRQPDLVLREMQAELAGSGHRISVPQLWRVVKRLGLVLKKSRSTPPNAIRRRTAASAKPSSKRSAGRRPKT
ncbi:MAG: transposase [Acidobacteria bacterium]|nr:transposase [Acidobacteriota bacterium]